MRKFVHPQSSRPANFCGRGIKFALLPDVAFPDCAPLAVLENLLEHGQLKRFAARWGRRKGDCHEITLDLIWDLFDAKSEGWAWLTGMAPSIGEHSWLERDDWAIDASNGGKNCPVLMMRSDTYRAMLGVTEVKRSFLGPKADTGESPLS